MAGTTQDTINSSVSIGPVEYHLTGRNVCDHLELISHVETYITCALDRYLPPFLIVFGLVSNIFVILVMRSRYFNTSSTSFYMVVNALTDSVSLVVALSVHYAYVNFPDSFEPIRSFDPMCAFFNIFGWATSDMGVLFTVAMTTERAIAIKYPLKAYKFCTIRRAKYVSLALTVFEMLKLLHLAFKSVVVDSSVTSHLCDVDKSDAAYAYFYDNVWTWLHVGILTICYVMVAIGNVIIIAYIRRSNNSDTLKALGRKPVLRKPSSSLGSSQSRQTSIMLVVDSICLVIFTLPFGVVILLTTRFDLLTNTEGGKNLAFSTTFYLLYVNRCMNFFLYCISGSRFRMALRDLFRSNRRSSRLTLEGARSNAGMNQSLGQSEDALQDDDVRASNLSKLTRLDTAADQDAMCRTVYLISPAGFPNDVHGTEEYAMSTAPRTTEFVCTQFDDVLGEDGSVSLRHAVHNDVAARENCVSKEKASSPDPDLQSLRVSQTVHLYHPIMIYVEQPVDHSTSAYFSKDSDGARHRYVKTKSEHYQIANGIHCESFKFDRKGRVTLQRNKNEKQLSTVHRDVSERGVSHHHSNRDGIPHEDHLAIDISDRDVTNVTEGPVVLGRAQVRDKDCDARNTGMEVRSQVAAQTHEASTHSIEPHRTGNSHTGVINWGFEADEDFDWLPDGPLTFL